MDTGYVISAVVLAVILCLAILVTALLWKRNKGGRSEQPNYRVFFIMGAIMVPMGLVEMALFWRWDIPFVIPLPLVGIGLLFLAISLANLGKWQRK